MTTNQILTACGETGGARFVSDEALWLTEDARVVEEGDPDCRFVLVGKGGNLPLLVAQALGLTGTKREQSDAVEQIESGNPNFQVVVRAEESTK